MVCINLIRGPSWFSGSGIHGIRGPSWFSGSGIHGIRGPPWFSSSGINGMYLFDRGGLNGLLVQVFMLHVCINLLLGASMV